jgi:two-component system nitrate/nitrite response regulator NarL
MIGVLVLTDVRFYREGLTELLSRSSVVRLAGAAADVEELLPLLAAGEAEVVLLDGGHPTAIDSMRRIAAVAPQAKVVALGLRESDHDIVAWAEAGLAGFVSRDQSVTDVVATVASVARGEAVCPPRFGAALLRRVAMRAQTRGERPEPEAASLTYRERQIALLVEQGLSNKEIAHRLGIQLATIKTHVHHILEKLHVQRRMQITRLVRRV